jgi:radical SAM protein with 4Fe4S-binding SPASM domain
LNKVNLPSLFDGLDGNKKFKLYRDLWQKSGQYEILTNFPLHLDIELAGICNLRCESCFQNGLIKAPLGIMPFDRFQRIIDEGVKNGLCAAKLQIRGESFLHPQLFDCIAYAKQKGVMDVQITTNGILLDKDKINKILNSDLDAIILSVDGHHGSSFNQKHNLHNYSVVEQKIKELLAARKRLGKSRPWVRLRASIPQCSADALYRTKAFLKSKFPEADIYIVGRIHDFRDDTDSYPDLHTSYALMPCSYLMQRLAIFWNGDVTTCCMDYNNQFKLGNLKDQAVEEIWHSLKMRNFRKLHLNSQRKSMPICKHCHVCVTARNPAVVEDNTPRHVADCQ